MLSDVLKKLAPYTPAAKRDRFVPFLEEAMPRYGIDTPKRQAAFLATCAYESAYFRATKEGRAKIGTKARRFQDRYWSTGYYGRGLIQLTHEKNYDAFNDHVYRSPALDVPDFIANPELVEQPRWAVESACWYWKAHGLNRWADEGDFYTIQDLVNTGNANDDKKPLHYEEREKAYFIALKALSSSPAPQAPATESATKPPVIILPVTEDKQDSAGDLSILDRVSSPFIAVKQKFDVLGVDPTKISKSSAVTTIGLKSWGAVLMAVSFFYDNPIYLGAATALIVVGAVVFIFAKRNATARTTNVQTTVNVDAK
jgi:putative chitinase